MKYYNVHYPDGTIKKHILRFEHRNLPVINGVFFNGEKKITNGYYRYTASIFWQIVELSEEDIWVEQIDYFVYSTSPFVFFTYGNNQFILIDYK